MRASANCQIPRKRVCQWTIEKRHSPLHTKPASLVADSDQTAAFPVVVLHHGGRLAPECRVPPLLHCGKANGHSFSRRTVGQWSWVGWEREREGKLRTLDVEAIHVNMGDHPGLLRLRPCHRHPLSSSTGLKITAGLCFSRSALASAFPFLRLTGWVVNKRHGRSDWEVATPSLGPVGGGHGSRRGSFGKRKKMDGQLQKAHLLEQPTAN